VRCMKSVFGVDDRGLVGTITITYDNFTYRFLSVCNYVLHIHILSITYRYRFLLYVKLDLLVVIQLKSCVDDMTSVLLVLN